MSNAIWNITLTQSSNRSAFGMRASGAHVPSYMELPCSFAGSAIGGAIDGPTAKRRVDVATEHTPGTLVWSPPT
ncbi:MAG: hypothetical protein M3Y66_02800 [Actinomycetota bacterium]|nr:hypothetical protein [Actinomycetota bacterium]